MADRIRVIIREMPQIAAPMGLLPSVMEAVKAKSDLRCLRVIDEQIAQIS